VKVKGTITDSASAIDLATPRFVVTDEYGLVHPTGPITLTAGGAYTADVPLMADRKGTDMDGRAYTIVVSGRNIGGLEGSATVIVRVPHDQGN
jgi:hypothetical protein